ncbi:hypothetical protein [Halorubrum ezzemoulense]|uniref:hypothetical protein n=1 Tax=Halorubrum ezzemoulense TaxID=337243 RepID=UPI00117A8C3F|nr:hypothetical protein [Halorubrum ezzemoulense]
MAKYEEGLPSFHLDIDEFEDLVRILSNNVNPNDEEKGSLKIKITEGNLTKEYDSVTEIREDATLPSDIRDVSITVSDGSTHVKMYWNSTGSFTTSKLRIRGDDTLVKSKADDLNRFLKNHKNRWRGYFSNLVTQFVLAFVISISSGVVLGSTILSESNAISIGIFMFNIALFAQFGVNRIYPRNLVVLRPDSANTSSLKKIVQRVITAIAVLAGLITILNYFN